MKRKISSKVLIAGIAVAIGLCGIGSTVLAAESYQPVTLNSYGIFSYDDGNSENNNGYLHDIFLDASDLTKLNNNLDVLKETSDTLTSDVSTLKTDVASCFQSVSDGKALLASTITDLGVDTSLDATFATINDNIIQLADIKYKAGKNAGGVGYVKELYHETSDVINNVTTTCGKKVLMVVVKDSSGGWKVWTNGNWIMNVGTVNYTVTVSNNSVTVNKTYKSTDQLATVWVSYY